MFCWTWKTVVEFTPSGLRVPFIRVLELQFKEESFFHLLYLHICVKLHPGPTLLFVRCTPAELLIEILNIQRRPFPSGNYSVWPRRVTSLVSRSEMFSENVQIWIVEGQRSEKTMLAHRTMLPLSCQFICIENSRFINHFWI